MKQLRRKAGLSPVNSSASITTPWHVLNFGAYGQRLRKTMEATRQLYIVFTDWRFNLSLMQSSLAVMKVAASFAPASCNLLAKSYQLGNSDLNILPVCWNGAVVMWD
mmetsp:Transcript_67064/g.132238  ORF Transcript_67064/g.132238 Transcript_67064/m.132238 type:complete len:107 (-) Transcript_67064:10-330(-)